MDKNNIEALAAILDTAEKHGNAEVQIRLVFHEEEKPDITDLSDQLGQLKEKLETVKAHRDELGEDNECCECDECDRFDYEEFSILDDKIDEVQSTVTDIHEAVKTMMEAIPNSFDKLTMNLMDNEGSAKIKKKNAGKIIDAIETCAQNRRDHSVQLYTDLKSNISETKDIALENQKRISNLINSLNAVIKIYDSSEDPKKNIIDNIYGIRLLARDNQHLLNDLYARQAEIEKKLEADDKNIINEVLTVRDYLRDAETCILYRQNKLEEKLDAILKAINKPAKKSSTTKKSTTTKSDKSTK